MRVIVQIWEECDGDLVYQNGCTLHIDIESRNSYVKYVYDQINTSEIYSRVVGIPSTVSVNASIYEIVKESKSLRIESHELSNMINMEEIIAYD